MSGRTAGLALLLTFTAGGPAFAQLPLAPTAAPRAATRGLERLATGIADQMQEAGAQPPLAVWARGESAELARAFAALLAAELAGRNLPAVALDAPDAARAEALARAGGHRALVRVTLGLDAGLLHARGDLLGTWVNFWSGAQPTRPPSPAAGIEASVDADAHALALASVPLPSTGPATGGPQVGEVRLVQGSFARIPGHTAALGAGDLDGDGKEEVLALTEDALYAFAPDGKLLVRRELRHLPPSPSPSREPQGALAVHPGPARVVFLTASRVRGEALSLEATRAEFRVLGPVERAPLGVAGAAPIWGALVAGQNTFTPALSIEGAHALTLALQGAFTTFSSFTSLDGTQLLAVLPDGTGLWRAGVAPDARTRTLQGLGAGSALVDVDGDGYAELVTSEAAFTPEPEALRVLRAPSLEGPLDGALAVRFRKELARGRVLQVVGADLDGQKAQSVLAAVWHSDGTTELLVFRRAR